jgi:hypothetical protein
MDQTKEELLAYFQTQDLATLQKLQKYSQQIIIPEEDLLVNVTMTQMLNKAHQLADTLFPEWTDRSKSDFGEFLVELFALNSEKDFWYINAFANEGILRKMRSYSNAFSKAITMGYTPTILKSSTANFSVIFAAGEETLYQRGDLVITVGGTPFTNDEEFTIPQSAEAFTLPISLKQGEHNQEDYTFNGFSAYIRRDGVDMESVLVVIDNIQYSRVKTFGNSGPSSTHYMILPEEDGSLSVFFGNNTLGVSPTVGKSIQLYYRKCLGTLGNIPIGACTVSESSASRPAQTATMLSAATGGTTPEPLSSIKEKAPLFFGNRRSAINEVTSQNILNSLPFIKRSKVITQNKYVIFRAIPVSGDANPSLAELAVIEEEFNPYVMLGFEASYSANSYVDLITAANPAATSLVVDVLIYKGYNSSIIENSVREILSDLTNPLVAADYGGSFKRSDVDIKIRLATKGVQVTTFKLVVGGLEVLMSDVTLAEYQIFSKINQANVIVRTNVY